MENLGDTLLIPEPDNGKADGEGHPAVLFFLEGPRAGKSYGLRNEQTTIGRAADADLQLDAPPVSKQHCKITRSKDAFYIEDLGSTNGIRVNGSPLAEAARHRLFHGDSVLIPGNTALFHQTGCFCDEKGSSRIVIDRSAVQREVDQVLADFQNSLNSPR